MANEVKIGILAILAVGLSFWGYKFIQGSNILTRSNVFYAVYDNVGGLQVGTPVQISGVNVGAVSAIDLSLQTRLVTLTLDLKRYVAVPKDTRAVIVSSSILGGQTIVLEYNKPCQAGVDCAVSGDTLTGIKRGMIEATLGEGGVENYLDMLKVGVQETLDTFTDHLLGEDSNSPVAQSARDLETTMSQLKSASAQLDQLLRSSSPDIKQSLDNLNALTATLAAQRDNIRSIIANADSLTQQLVAADLEKTLEEVKTAVAGLRNTLASADQAMVGVNQLVGKVQNGEGTLGKLVNDEQLYQQLSQLSVNLDSIVVDIQEHPYRYIPLKSRRRVERYDRQDANEQ